VQQPVPAVDERDVLLQLETNSVKIVRRSAVSLIVLALATPARAQDPILGRIREEGLERSRVLEVFSTLTNVFGPRVTATPAFRASADWARKRLEEYGMRDARLEAFDFGRGWTLEKLTLEMTSPRYFPLIGFPDAWSPSTRGIVEARAVYVGDKTAADIEAMGASLRGAVVLAQPAQSAFIRADRPQPADTDQRVRIGAPPALVSSGPVPFRDMLPLLQRAGAAVVLRPSQGQHGTLFVTGRRDTPDDAVPSIVLAAEHYNTLVRLAQSATPPVVRVEVRARYHTDDTNGYNVLAEIPGTDPVLRNEVVLVGAHLDSWHSAPGATDNADGVATAMEAMRILNAVGARPRRTIRIALWGGEEQGLLGSRAYVAKHLAGPANAAARAAVYVYLNDDPGSGPTYGFYMQDNAAAKAVFDAWLEPLKSMGGFQGAAVPRRNVIDAIGNTDHLSFNAQGIPAFNTIKDYVDYDVRTHHTNADFPERVMEADLKQSAIVLAAFAWQASGRAERLPPPALQP
jgi:carboxypeptidase Q